MTPPDQFLYEYSVVRYVPRVDREEFVNIGLVMMCKRQKWLKGEIEINAEKLLAFDPLVNLQNLKNQTAFFKRNDVPSGCIPIEEKYRWLSSVKSAVIQTSPSHPGFIKIERGESDSDEILNREFERLFKDLVL